jgi:hypothetical protein
MSSRKVYNREFKLEVVERCQDRGKNPENNRDKNRQAQRSRVGYFSFLAAASSEAAAGRSLSLRR